MGEKAADDEAKLSLKLMVHKKEKRVIFAEADNHFVDTLFSIMKLPLGTIVKILEECSDEKINTALGSLKNLYCSLKGLSKNYFTSDHSKDKLLNPKSSIYNLSSCLKLSIEDTEPPENTPRYCGLFLDNVTTYIVTDDLRVEPNTPGFCLQLFRDLGINDTSEIEKAGIDVGRDEILSLLKAALLFKNPLSYMVFHNRSSAQSLDEVTPETIIHHLTSNELAALTKKMKLNVTLRMSASQFLFAVVEGDFVDFLLGFLEIPLGTMIGKLMNCNSSFKSLNNLFTSISTLKVGYIKSQTHKDLLLQPDLALDHVSRNQIFCFDLSKGMQKYCCRSFCCEDHLVKPHAKFILTDDFGLLPVSSFDIVSWLNEFKVPLNDIVEHEVSVDFEEGLKILKASLNSSTPLTDALENRDFWMSYD